MKAKQLKTDQAKLETNKRYMQKLEQLTVRFHSDGTDGVIAQEVKEAAEAAGESTNAFILEAIRQRMNQQITKGSDTD